MAVGIIVCVPIAVFILTGKLELIPSWDLIQKTVGFVIHAAIWTGTILWIWQEFFPDKKE
ncbi:MAG: hypothetical protein HOP06_03500 [Methylotenera sp.]|nr:hypothetical protein [Methylotenera sp.]